MSDDDTDMYEGVDLSNIESELEDLSYPVTAEELVERYGDRELGRTNADPITIEELFEYMGETSFESKRQVHQMIIGQMPRDSEGRTNYSDRGGSHPVETEAAEEAEEQTTADLEEGESTDPDATQDDA